jgi:hypothetical protein
MCASAAPAEPVALLDHPGRPGPGLVEEVPPAAFPDVRAPRPLATALLLVIAGVLLLEWLLYALFVTD